MEEEKKNPKPKGGKRDGAGRKSKGKEGTLRVGFRCSQDVYDILQMQSDKTAYFEAAIREKYRRENYR
jgi:hypothetical protein